MQQLQTKTKLDKNKLQKIIFSILKEGNYNPREVFPGFYQILTGQNFGPKAADLILELGREK